MMQIVAKTWRTGHLRAFGTMIVHVSVQNKEKKVGYRWVFYFLSRLLRSWPDPFRSQNSEALLCL